MAGPIDPTFNTATWGFAIADLRRDGMGFHLPSSGFLTPLPEVVRYTRRRNGYCELSLEVQNREDLNTLRTSAYTKVLRAWRNGNNRFNGQFVEVREAANSWEFVAKDPYFNMNWREVQDKIKYTDVEIGQMAWDLIDAQNQRGPVFTEYSKSDSHLRQGDTSASTEITRTFIPGDRVNEKVEDLMQLEDAPYFTIDGYDGPLDGDEAAWAKISMHYPADEDSATNEAARFEFGPGTLENCYDYGRESLPLVNRINIVAANPRLVVTASSDFYDDYGLWEGSRGQVMTNDVTALGELASLSITDSVMYGLTMMAGPEAPQLFTDFDVGQFLPIIIRRRGQTLSGLRRVLEATVLLDPDSGAEELESITFEDPGED